MTCAHVLDLIDAGPFAVSPPAVLEAAHAHAAQCRTCGPASRMMRALETELAALAEPAPPPDLRAAVLSRIAESRVAAQETGSSESFGAAWPRWPAWTGAAGGAAALVAIQSMAGTDASVFTPRTAPVIASLIDFPPPGSALLVLAIGLVLYAKGLFSVTATPSPVRRGATADTGSVPR